MPSTGETAPTLTATYRGSDHETFDLADHLGDGPVVLAFFAGASTPPCSNEMVVLQEHLDEFEAAGATVFGVSADSSFSQAPSPRSTASRWTCRTWGCTASPAGPSTSSTRTAPSSTAG